MPAAREARELIADILGGFDVNDRELRGQQSFAGLRTRLNATIERLR